MERLSRGVVEAFDDHRGLGAIRTEDGRLVEFHCIGIADGSRTIAVGRDVVFRELPKLGRYEATDIRPQ
jgi:cold shock CspA family protein